MSNTIVQKYFLTWGSSKSGRNSFMGHGAIDALGATRKSGGNDMDVDAWLFTKTHPKSLKFDCCKQTKSTCTSTNKPLLYNFCHKQCFLVPPL